MKINWIVRIKNKVFWMSFIPALALVVNALLDVFGIQLNLNELVEKLLKIVSAVFALLALLGIVNDPTTSGIQDSQRALTYHEPWEDTTVEPEDK